MIVALTIPLVCCFSFSISFLRAAICFRPDSANRTACLPASTMAASFSCIIWSISFWYMALSSDTFCLVRFSKSFISDSCSSSVCSISAMNCSLLSRKISTSFRAWRSTSFIFFACFFVMTAIFFLSLSLSPDPELERRDSPSARNRLSNSFESSLSLVVLLYPG